MLVLRVVGAQDTSPLTAAEVDRLCATLRRLPANGGPAVPRRLEAGPNGVEFQSTDAATTLSALTEIRVLDGVLTTGLDFLRQELETSDESGGLPYFTDQGGDLEHLSIVDRRLGVASRRTSD